jgi:predicted methyltransferase
MWRAGIVAVLLQLGMQAPPRADVETANRDRWQRPQAVMDALHIRPGSRVADIGAGAGYFTFTLARRVGAKGRVFAEDIQPTALADIGHRASLEHLAQITTVQGTDEDPMLAPGSVDAVLVVNSYHEMKAFDSMMQGFRRALKPHGLLGVIEPEAIAGELPGSAFRHHRIASDTVLADAARNGLRLVRKELGFVNVDAGIYSGYWFFLIFEPS